MTETDAEFVERMAQELDYGLASFADRRLFALARRGAAVQCKPCRLCGAMQHWMPLPPPPAGETSDE